MYKNTSIGILLFITHILACISVGIIFRFWKRNEKSSASHQNINPSSASKENITFF